ncbi:MAG: CHAT domain-containing protein [Caldilinea sp.]|nr:CHAT domain-containing protein [Caldilinea sp.]MDW8439075.1 CHAT domain-containing protein [Caldilineaceae bacterium]
MQPQNYFDFEVDLGPSDDAIYPLAVLTSPAGTARSVLALPHPLSERSRWRMPTAPSLHLEGVQTASASLPQRSLFRKVAPLFPWLHADRSADQADEMERFAAEMGRRLADALFNEQVLPLFLESRQRAADTRYGLRIKLRLRAAELAILPWELLVDPSSPVEAPRFLALSRWTPVVRYQEGRHRLEALEVRGRLHILAMGASPSDLPPIDVAAEQRHLNAAFPQWSPLGAVEWVQGQTWRDLQEALQKGPYHTFHFVGHTLFDESCDAGYLALADADGKAELHRGDEIAALLADHPTLRLVVVNACESAEGSISQLNASIAAMLVERSVPAVVAMQTTIGDRGALEFARSFYRSVANRLPVDAACAEARKAMRLATERSLEWVTPTLSMQTPEGQLFTLEGKPLRWPKILSILLILTFCTVSGFGAITWLSMQPPAPQGEFNVAVAEFEMLGRPSQWQPYGRLFGGSLAEALENEYRLSQMSEVDVVHRNVGVIHDEREAAALAERGFQMVLYGSVGVVDSQMQAFMKIYVADAFHNDMGEITGAHDFAIPLFFSTNEVFTYTQVFSQRASLLVDLIQGIHLAAENRLADAAVALGRAAAEAERLGTFSGKEVIYLFASDVARRQGKHEAAEQLALRALALNPQYGRGYIALGNSRFARGSAWLASALEAYQSALALPGRPPSAFVAEKANFGAGQVYLNLYSMAAQDGSPYAEAYAIEAERHYRAVIESFSELTHPTYGNRELLALAHLGAGYLAQLRNLPDAVEHFCRALAVSSKPEHRRLAQEHLTELDAECGALTPLAG